MRDFPLLREILPPLLDWTTNHALPFWGTVGVDAARGGFHERLDLLGQPVLDVPKRLMVQGRQLYVYSQAGLLGWYPDSRLLADRCVEYIVASFYRRDGNPGWVHSLAPDGSIGSAIRETYAHAFVLLGLAWYHRLTRDAQVLKIVDETWEFLDEAAGSIHGGYFDAVPGPCDFRRQNPHMHLFESGIALYHATGDARYLARCGEIFALFSAKFFRPPYGTLCEYMTRELHPLQDPRGRISEPGHHYEWIWLLRLFQRASGRNVDPYCVALYEYADRYGWDAKGFVIDELTQTGKVLKNSRRSWPHAEALKANIVEGECGRLGCDERAARCVARLLGTFIGRPIRGGWIDHTDGAGRPIVTMIPASTLYHIFCATTEAARAIGEPGESTGRAIACSA